MKRTGNIYPILISDENLRLALEEVNRTHRWNPRHRPNRVVAWVESDVPARIRELRAIIEEGFTPSPAALKRRWDKSAGKWRDIHEPKLWPDQYIHHALIQAIQPTLMRKRNLLRLGRQLRSCYRKWRRGAAIPLSLAVGLLSRLGQLRHCRSTALYARMVKPKTQRRLKAVVRAWWRKERARWTTSLEARPGTA